MRADHRFGVCLRWPADARTRVLRRFLLGPWPGFGPNGRSGRFGKILGQIEFVVYKEAWRSPLFWGQVSVPAHPPPGPTGYAFSVERLKPLTVIIQKPSWGSLQLPVISRLSKFQRKRPTGGGERFLAARRLLRRPGGCGAGCGGPIHRRGRGGLPGSAP